MYISLFLYQISSPLPSSPLFSSLSLPLYSLLFPSLLLPSLLFLSLPLPSLSLPFSLLPSPSLHSSPLISFPNWFLLIPALFSGNNYFSLWSTLVCLFINFDWLFEGNHIVLIFFPVSMPLSIIVTMVEFYVVRNNIGFVRIIWVFIGDIPSCA